MGGFIDLFSKAYADLESATPEKASWAQLVE
jgi:hypothetical protein